MSAELLATSWTTTGPNQTTDGVTRSTLDIRDRARAAAQAGFAGIGFTLEDLEAGLDVISWPDLKRLCDDLGFAYTEVELITDWWTSGDRRQRSDVHRNKLLDAATVLGARQIKIAGEVVKDAVSMPPQTMDLPAWAGELNHLAAQAQDAGTRVALEVLPMSNIADFTEAARLIEAADHACAGLTVDIWHLERGPSTLEDLAGVPGEKVFCVELNDAHREQVGTLLQDTMRNRQLCGEGDFDVRGFISTLQGIGFDGPWGVEIISDVHHSRPLAESLPDVVRTALKQF
ncbi:sugar phosphate isomerase/epimerase family protein [Terrabacter terrigena]|uniref:Sugar phosphate isomerase/epimerase family protein n=1 Tax=Terrabacter terrigena TaxID=574718 RepID=A0ABW3N1W5_9MICO